MDYNVKDLNLAPDGQQKINWAARWMKVLNRMADRFSTDGIFKGKRIALCIHLEAKTAYLATVLQRLGAEVWITSSNALSTKDDVCAALAKNGIHVFAKHGANQEEYRQFIRDIVSANPNAVVDDGGDICEFFHSHPEYASNLKGICEETTSGVKRLKELAATNRLRYPAVAINEARSKYLFDNRYGTGQSTWTAITALTNITIAGKTVVIIGYGWVGRGLAIRAAGLGANVIVTEIDPWKGLEAKMDGFRVMPIMEAAPLGHFFITATGENKVLRPEHVQLMPDGAFLANAGHFDYEIDVPGLQKIAQSVTTVRDEVEEYVLPNGNRIYLLAQGGIINIAGGLGHPIEILDLSFALQLSCLHYVLGNNLTPGFYYVPVEIDEMVVRERLNVDGCAIDIDMRPKK
ncbi:MAG TPA: adenosylhomocysteinase [Candidatus Marinimicrobia bacterium]|nr:adenosylhomocysteinase [Candidatus Neomarinimicrobiota bacterium]HRS51901.1 adenosylhomocysteinase [Candidatus Neomarinimicrobiota bacterium]